MTVYDPASASTSASADAYDDFGVDDAALVSLTPPRRRSTTRVVAGVGLVSLSAMIGAYIFVASSPDTTRVMVAAGELAPGEAISAGDMRVVEVGDTSGLDVVGPDGQDVLIGLAPRSVIPDGAVLNPSFFVTAEDAIPAGKVIVGAVLAAGSAPTDRLREGDPVGLIRVVSGLGGSEASPVMIGDGEVWAIGPVSDGSVRAGGLWVSLLVDENIQLDVAQAASAEQLWVTAVRSGS